MQRRNFLKSLFGFSALAAATMVGAKPLKDDTFAWDDVTFLCTGNKDLFYIRKDSWLNQELEKIMGDRVVDRKYFSYYEPKRDILIPVKDRYTKEDFNGILLWAKSLYPFNYYCNGTGNGGIETGLCRFIRDNRHGMYEVEFFSARNPKTY